MPNPEIKLGISMQGGGVYGAYTKGVLRALFTSKAFLTQQIVLQCVTGTSSGAANAVLFADGYYHGGIIRAIQQVDDFWVDFPRINPAPMVTDVVNIVGRFNGAFGYSYPNLVRNPWTQSLIPDGYISKGIANLIAAHCTDLTALDGSTLQVMINHVEEYSEQKLRRHVVTKNGDITPDIVAASCGLEEFGGHIIGNTQCYDGANWQNPYMPSTHDMDITDLLVITVHSPIPGQETLHQDEARMQHAMPGHELLTGEIFGHMDYIVQNHPALNLHCISMSIDPHWDQTSRGNTDSAWLMQLDEMGYADAEAWHAKHANKLGRKSSYVPHGHLNHLKVG